MENDENGGHYRRLIAKLTFISGAQTKQKKWSIYPSSNLRQVSNGIQRVASGPERHLSKSNAMSNKTCVVLKGGYHVAIMIATRGRNAK